MNETIRCFYSCNDCGLKKIPVDIAVRGEENVLQWMEGVALPAFAQDHARRSPSCFPRSLSDVMIPIADGQRVGDPAGH